MITTEDKLINGKISITQSQEGYRVGIDPIILASLVEKAEGKILDLGAGVGTISLCLLLRQPGLEVFSIENNRIFYDLSLINKQNNCFASNYTPLYGDIREFTELHNAFTAVVTNPPFYKKATNNPSPTTLKRVAHVEESATLHDFISAGYMYLQPKGKLYMIQRVDRLPDILQKATPNKWGEVTLYPIRSFKNMAAERVIIVLTKLSKKPFKIAEDIIIHNEDKSYTNLIKKVLEVGKSYFTAKQEES